MRVAVAVALGLLVALDILLLKPSSLEVDEAETRRGLFKDLSQMVKTQKPDDEIQYTIQGFHYTSVEGEVKEWEMTSDTAVLYEGSKNVVAANARIKMFDSAGKITYIEGKEAHYKMGAKDFELFHDVKVTFPDGFWIKTEQARYVGATQVVSSAVDFYGESQKTKTEHLQVWGKGFTASRNDPYVHVLSETRAKIHRFNPKEIDDVRSDQAKLDRFKKVSLFTMDRSEDRVESMLGTLQVRSKRQEANYDGASHQFNYMTAFDDVYIKETAPQQGGLKYATCQRADFVAKDDKILMTGFPSLYQENDTVTGELITYYRGKSLVEVSQANGFHAPKATE